MDSVRINRRYRGDEASQRRALTRLLRSRSARLGQGSRDAETSGTQVTGMTAENNESRDAGEHLKKDENSR